MCCQQAGSKRKTWKIQLTSDQAQTIYARRGEAPGSCTRLALEFGVSVKTIRDIWNRETWTKATCSLWTAHEQKLHLASLQAKVVNAPHSKHSPKASPQEGPSAPAQEHPANTPPPKLEAHEDEEAQHSDAGTRAHSDDEKSPSAIKKDPENLSNPAESRLDGAAVAPVSVSALRCASAADAEAVAGLLNLQFAR